MPAPDLILINADIVTMDPLFPRVQALAVKDGRVVALGPSEEMRDLADSRTQVIDCGGRMVLPGFQDTHIHLQDSGRDYAQNAELDAARTIDELVATMKAF